MKVGTKELKNRLSYYLRQVRQGEPVYVADRGEVVAEIKRLRRTDDPDEEALGELAGEGLLTRGEGRFKDFAPIKLPRGASLSRAVVEDRE